MIGIDDVVIVCDVTTLPLFRLHCKKYLYNWNLFTCLGSSFHTTTWRKQKSSKTDLVKQLRAKIKLSGPITVAEYMKEVLTNPIAVSVF